MKRQLTASFFLLLILTTGFRLIHLEADPPSDFSWSGGYFADEGFWSHNARNAVLFGNPVQDDWDARIVSPVFAHMQGFVFQLFGSGFAQVRFIAIFSSLVLAAAAFLLFKSELDPQRSFLYAVLVSLNYPMMILGRQGILDPFAAALCSLALLLLMQEARISAFCAGILFVATCITKYLMIYAIVPVFFLVWVSKRYIPFLGGMLIGLAAWLLLNYLPHRDLLSAYSAYYASQQSWEFASVLKNIALQPFYLYFVKTPAILCLANLGLWFVIARLLDPPREDTAGLSRLEKMFFLWLIAGILFFALWRYRPFRYYTSLIPPMVAMAVFALFRLSTIAGEMRRSRSKLVLFAGVLLPFVQIAFLLWDRFSGRGIIPRELGIDSFDAVLFLTFTIIVLWSLGVGGRKIQYAIWAFVAVFALSDVRNYMSWAIQPQYAAQSISRDLQTSAAGGVITGQWAPELCLDNNLRVIPVWQGFVNSEHPFRNYGITHILQWKYSLGGEKFEDWYPEDFQNFRLVKKYRIKDSDLLLYERNIPQEGMR